MRHWSGNDTGRAESVPRNTPWQNSRDSTELPALSVAGHTQVLWDRGNSRDSTELPLSDP